MATATARPPRQAQRQGPSVFLRTVLPVLFLLTLLAGVVAAAVYAVFWYLPRIQEGKEFLFRRFQDPILLGGKEYNLGVWWLGVLVPLLVVGLVYVVWMYVRDGVTIGWAWATFLGALRCTVYALLAIVFLLPSFQEWEETRTESKVAVVFDVSGSMLFTRDEIPTPETPLDKLPSRQDNVLSFLADEKVAFFKRLHEKNPVTAYRFGRHLDEVYLVLDKSGQLWSHEAWENRQRGSEEAAQAARPIQMPVNDFMRGWLKPDLNPDIPESLPDKEREEFLKRLDNLRRLCGATNVGTPNRKVFDREKNNLVQGIVVFTDGRNTEGSTEPLKALIDDARKADPPIPIFVVAVGEERERVKIEIADLRVPEQIRPEDRFRASIDLTGEGLVDKEVDVFLDIYRVSRKNADKDVPEGSIDLVEMKPDGTATGADIKLEPRLVAPNVQGPNVTLKATAKFLPGNPPQAQVEFPLDAATLAKAAGKEPADGMKLEFKDDPEGMLRFRARVARDPREDFVQKEHRSDAADVNVVKRPLRVLVMASGPMRDYQFVSVLLDRESRKGRAEMSIYLQPVPGQENPRQGRVQNVDPERLLTRFPDKLQDEKDDKPDDKHYNLANYDVIIAFDPDWTRLSEQQLKMIELWVEAHGGGLILVGGPVNTLQLARPGAAKDKLAPMIHLYPVHLADSRVQEVTRETDRPWRLNFPGATGEMEFLKLDEEDRKDEDPRMKLLKGWEKFFLAGPNGEIEPGQDKKSVRRGIFNFYPVKQKKDIAVTVATFTDDRARLEDGSEQPYIVTMPYKAGRTVWIGSAETWRLRQFKETYHERFWTKLARYASTGRAATGGKRITNSTSRNHTAGNYIRLEAKAFGRDMNPLPQKSKIIAVIKPPPGLEKEEPPQTVELTAKPSSAGQWGGYFTGRVLIKTPGQYTVEMKVPETGDTETTKITVREANPEMDNTRPDFASLHDLASDAEYVLARVKSEDERRELRARLQRRKPALSDPNQPRSDADAVKKDAAPEARVRLYFDLSTADLIPSLMSVESRPQRNRGASNDLWDGGFTIWDREPPEQPVKMSTILAIVAGLLSIEWLTRKLLRLA